MELVAFDTHQFIQTLSQSGMPVEQAEAISNAVRMAYAHGASDLVTKADLAVVKQDLAEVKQDLVVVKQDLAEVKQELVVVKQDIAAVKQDIAEVKANLATKADKRDLAEVKAELEHSIKLLEKSMTIRLGSMLFIAVGVMMAFMKYMQA